MTIEDIQYKIETTDAILLYFSGKNCGVCKALMPKITSSVKDHFPKIKQLIINTDDYPKIAAHFSIFTVPSVLIFFEGKESKRENKYISVEQLIQSTKRQYKLFFN